MNKNTRSCILCDLDKQLKAFHLKVFALFKLVRYYKNSMKRNNYDVRQVEEAVLLNF